MMTIDPSALFPTVFGIDDGDKDVQQHATLPYMGMQAVVPSFHLACATDERGASKPIGTRTDADVSLIFVPQFRRTSPHASTQQLCSDSKSIKHR
jgi:hypothetical protein